MSAKQPERWYQNAIFYELYVRAFRDSNGTGHGDLVGVIEKLDYLHTLGIDCIWLLPIYPSPLEDDGYDISDYCGIHPDYGTIKDFDRLIREAHARGLRVITDLVINHTSDQHSWFVNSRSSRGSAKRNWYVWSDTDQRYRDTRIIFTDTENSNWAYDERTRQYYWHRFYSSQPDLNFDNPEVRKAMLDVMRFWLDRGIDGFRVDAVPYLIERDGTNCENLPETHIFVKEMRRLLDTQWPNAIILAEANQPPDDLSAYFGSGDEFHMAFHFPLMPRIFEAIHLQRAEPIKKTLNLTPAIPDGCQWCTFLRNHDELTLEMVTDEERRLLWDAYAPGKNMRLNIGIRRRLAPLLNNDIRKIILANCILFSLPGTPVIYYGDEIGMGDDLDLPDRGGVRTPMQWDTSLNAGFSIAPSDKLFAPVITDPDFGYQTVNTIRQLSDPDSLFNQMRSLIALRKQHPALSQGSLSFLTISDVSVLAFGRSMGDERFIIAHNLSDVKQEIVIDPLSLMNYTMIDALKPTAAHSEPEHPSSRHLSLEPYQSLWLRLAHSSDA